MYRSLGRKGASAAAALAVVGIVHPQLQATSCQVPTLDEELVRIRSFEKEMRERWIKDEDHWRKLPSRVWPVYHPSTSEQPQLEENIKRLCGNDLSNECNHNRFDLATLLVFNTIDPKSGFNMYKTLAAEGYVDGIVATGVCLVEGFGTDQDYEQGVEYLQRASALGHPHADYELAVLYYTGAAYPALPGNETLAFEFFERAMTNGKFSYATYMVADLLLDQADSSKYGRALQLMYEAADNGHRFARQEVLAFLAGRHRVQKK